MTEAIIRLLAKALLLRYPTLKQLLSEQDLVALLTDSWAKVRNWAEAHGESLRRAAVEFRRSVFAVMKRLARRPWGPPPAEAGSLSVGGAIGGPTVLAGALDKLAVENEIAAEARRRLAGDAEDNSSL